LTRLSRVDEGVQPFPISRGETLISRYYSNNNQIEHNYRH